LAKPLNPLGACRRRATDPGLRRRGWSLTIALRRGGLGAPVIASATFRICRSAGLSAAAGRVQQPPGPHAVAWLRLSDTGHPTLRRRTAALVLPGGRRPASAARPSSSRCSPRRQRCALSAQSKTADSCAEARPGM